MDGNVGSLDWRDCYGCVHYRDDKGGCEPLDAEGQWILHVDLARSQIVCRRYEGGDA